MILRSEAYDGTVASLACKKRDLKKKKFYNKISIAKSRIRCEGIVQKNALQVLGKRGWGRQAGDGEDGGAFWGRPEPRRGCAAIHGWMDISLHHTTSRIKYFHYEQAPLQCFATKHSESYQWDRPFLHKHTVKQINSTNCVRRDSVTRSRNVASSCIDPLPSIASCKSNSDLKSELLAKTKNTETAQQMRIFP